MAQDKITRRWSDENGDLFRTGRNGSHFFTEEIEAAFTPRAGFVTRTYVSKAEAENFDPDPYGELEVSE